MLGWMETLSGLMTDKRRHAGGVLLANGPALGETAVVALGLHDEAVLAFWTASVAVGGHLALIAALEI